MSPVRACATRRAATFEPVVGRLAPQGTVPLALGTTDDDGRLEIDLKRLPAAAVKAAPEPKRLILYMRATVVGEVSLVPSAREADDAAWSEAEADGGGCAAPPPARPCWHYHRYLEDFPEGLHAGEARAGIEQHRALAKEEATAEEARDHAEVQARLRAARWEAASTAARAAAAHTCRVTCRARCNGDAACADACTGRICEGVLLGP